MITPNNFQELSLNDSRVESYIAKIDDAIREYALHPSYPWVEVQIAGEIEYALRNAIAAKYMEAGWDNVVHYTSSELRETYGLTTFVLCTEDTNKLFSETYHNPSWRREVPCFKI